MCASGNKKPHFRIRRNRLHPRGWLAGLLCIGLCASLGAADLDKHRVEDFEYGRALYYFFQDRELDAITHLMIADASPRERSQRDESNLLLADLYYGYGLYEESRNLFADLLTAEVSDSVQNRIWFNLARLRYEQGFHDQARDLLSRISESLPASIEAERKYLLTNLYLGNGQYDEAADLSNTIDPDSIWKLYARYNLGVSVIEDGDYQQGRTLLEKIGQTEAPSAEILALRDRANLSLGLKQLRMDLNQPALESLARIRLEGPLSHEALLASGWAWYRLDQPEKALLPWRLLLSRNAVDAATQEAILAIPSSYAEAGRERLAVKHFEIAAVQFDAQLTVLDDAIESIESDELIDALRESAILYDRNSLQRLPPSSDVTPQLHLLMASAGFQREVRRYQQLLDIRNSLGYWDSNFPALELMLAERRRGFAERLPKVKQSSDFDRLAELRSRRDRYAARLADIEAQEDYAALAGPEERDHLERLDRVAGSIAKVGGERNTVQQQDMLRLLSGLLHYELETDYPVRRWKARKQLILLDRALGEADARASRLRRIADIGELQFDTFEQRIAGQQGRIVDLRLRVTELLGEQETLINRMAIDAIRAQQRHIVQLRLNARFELAKLYDKLAAEQ